MVIQVVCGQNCSFLVQSNGTVLAVGEGQYGRLGQGNSDDLYIPTIIAAFQGTISSRTLAPKSELFCCLDVILYSNTIFIHLIAEQLLHP